MHRPLAGGSRAVPVALTGLLFLTACGTVDRLGGEGSSAGSSCVARLLVRGQTFEETGRDHPRVVPGTTVDAVLPGCNDTGANGVMAEEADVPVEAHAIIGVAPDLAVLWHGDLYLRRGAELPPQLRVRPGRP